MKKLKSILTLLVLVMLCGSAQLKASPIKHLNLSLWSEYKKVDFQGLSQEEKTEKLQKLFNDKCQFVKQHTIRRAIVRILDPVSFDFFNPENFDSSRDDNFYYWALKLNATTEVEALLDADAFHVTPQSLSQKFYDFYAYYFKSNNQFGSFQNLVDKLLWVTLTNDTFDPDGKKGPLLKGITLDPKGESEGICQNLINALDQYKCNVNELLPENNHFHIRRAILLNMDQKDFAFANLALFPLQTDLRGEKPNSIGLKTPENFPSEGPNYLAPAWRSEKNHALLETVYIRMYDPRLVECVYQNSELLPDPTVYNASALTNLSHNLGDVFRGTPFMKGPGYINNARGTSEIEGLYTYFKTGGGEYQEGQFLNGSYIEVRPPYLSQAVRKVVSEDPMNNRQMKITSTFSTTQDVEHAEYFYSPIPMNWSQPKVSPRIHGGIYYVFSTNFEPKKGRFLGNWSVDNFVKLIYNTQTKTGFLYELFFSVFTHHCCWAPKNNIVLYDFTTLPNGDPYPECDWKLGNQTY